MCFWLLPHVFSIAVSFGYTHEPVENSRNMKTLAARGDSRLEAQKAVFTGSFFASPCVPAFLLLGLCCVSPDLHRNESELIADAYYCLLRT